MEQQKKKYTHYTHKKASDLLRKTRARYVAMFEGKYPLFVRELHTKIESSIREFPFYKKWIISIQMKNGQGVISDSIDDYLLCLGFENTNISGKEIVYADKNNKMHYATEYTISFIL